MNRLRALTALLVCLSINSVAQTAPGLHGVVTDPSGASVPGALVQLHGPGLEQRATTDADRARKLLASHGDASTNWDEILRDLANAQARLAAAAGATAAAGAPAGVEA